MRTCRHMNISPAQAYIYVYLYCFVRPCNPPEGSFPVVSPWHLLSPPLFASLFPICLCWFERWRAVKGLSSKRSLHMSPIGGVWLGARPKLTELCLFLLLALILPPVQGPGGPGEGRWKTACGSTADNFTKFASFTGSYKDSASEGPRRILHSHIQSLPLSSPSPSLPSRSLRLAPREVLLLSRPHPPTHSHRQRVCLRMPLASWYFAWHLPCFKGEKRKWTP